MSHEYKSEVNLQKACRAMMVKVGLYPRKQGTMYHRGLFDYYVLGKFRWIMFVEFKLPGRKLTPFQQVEYDRLKLLQHTGVIVRSKTDCMELVIKPYQRFLEENSDD